MKKKFIILICAACAACGFYACSDEPDTENFYTFTGEMMSDYLHNRAEYSQFSTIVERAGLMDLLSTYGKYTCFLPSNDAVDSYLQSKGLQSLDQLTDADCDTIARTHLVNDVCSTYELGNVTLYTFLARPLATSVDSMTAEIIIDGLARIIFEQKDDSVENGIMQPIDMVLEKSNSYVADRLRDNSRLGIFYEALVATGVVKDITGVSDPDYDANDYELYYYKSHTWSEVAWAPDTKKVGYTFFIEPDSIYQQKFQEYGISTASGTLRAVYDLACLLYDPVYPDDVNAPGHSFENLTDSVNPLKRFVQYHVLTRQVGGVDELTAPVMRKGIVNEAFGFDTKIMNPVDWYQTMLPHTMMKIEQLTMTTDEAEFDCVGRGVINDYYVNRRYGGGYQIEGAHIDGTVDISHDALNGHYFFVDDLVAFSYEVQNIVQNMRIRMDFSSVFPEVMTNQLRQNGDPFTDDDAGTPDDSPLHKNGRNFYFPQGYLDGVTFSVNSHLVLRRPHVNFWSWQGDEWNIFGDYDLTFRIPPVPYTGDWQLRLGFCALETRGVMQVYFDGIPQGIPLDMTKYLDSELYIGDRFVHDEALGDYKSKTAEEKAEEQKLLRNLGAYRDGRAQYHFDQSGSSRYFFLGNERTYRRILCQTRIDATKDHYLRFRVASDGKKGNNNEFMLDFFEMVPKSVYGVDGDGEMEDDL